MKRLLLALTCSALFLSNVNASSVSQAVELQNAFSQVADKAFPAVVVINVSRKLGRQQQTPQLPPGFEFFFGPRHFRQQPANCSRCHQVNGETGREIRFSGLM